MIWPRLESAWEQPTRGEGPREAAKLGASNAVKLLQAPSQPCRLVAGGVGSGRDLEKTSVFICSAWQRYDEVEMRQMYFRSLAPCLW